MAFKFTEKRIKLPRHDCDVILVFPGGKELTIQMRSSNADVNYNGSLDIILPENQLVTAWEGDDMKDSKAPNKRRQHQRIAKQFVAELPGDYHDD